MYFTPNAGIKIVGLIGAKRAGKSTTFDIISKIFPANEIMLAEKLKQVCLDVLCLSEDAYTNPDLEELPLPVPYMLLPIDIDYILRKFDIVDIDVIRLAQIKHNGMVLFSQHRAAQYIGTEILRDIDHGIHVRHALNATRTGVLNVVTDIRFPDELATFRELFPTFKLIYVKRDSAEADAASDTHVSEASLSKLVRYADTTIHNNGTWDDLPAEVVTRLLEIITPTFDAPHGAHRSVT